MRRRKELEIRVGQLYLASPQARVDQIRPFADAKFGRGIHNETLPEAIQQSSRKASDALCRARKGGAEKLSR